MKRKMRALAPLALCLTFAGCTNLGILEDVGDDPHPPQLQLLGVAYQPTEPTPAPEPKAAAALERAATPDIQPADGFVVRPNDGAANSILFRVQYSDFGGDIESISITDLDGSTRNSVLALIPVEVDLDGDGVPDPQPDLIYDYGTSGTADLGYLIFPVGVEGPHRMEMWAEDSHGSRSAKIFFTFMVVN